MTQKFRIKGTDVAIGLVVLLLLLLLLLLFLEPDDPARDLVFGGLGPAEVADNRDVGTSPVSRGEQHERSVQPGVALGANGGGLGAAGFKGQASNSSPAGPATANPTQPETGLVSPNGATGPRGSTVAGGSMSGIGQHGGAGFGPSGQEGTSSATTGAPALSASQQSAQRGGDGSSPASASETSESQRRQGRPGASPDASGGSAGMRPSAPAPPVMAAASSANSGATSDPTVRPGPGAGVGPAASLESKPQDGTVRSTTDLLAGPRAEVPSGAAADNFASGKSRSAVSVSTLAQQAVQSSQVGAPESSQAAAPTTNAASAAGISSTNYPDANAESRATQAPSEASGPFDAWRGSKVVFVLDQSRSMKGERSAVARRELVKTLGTLRSNQMFYVFFFHSSGYDAMPTTGLLQATPESVRCITNWIFSAGHYFGSDPTKAMVHALELEPDTVWLLSDGEFPDKACDKIRAANRSLHAQINTVGFFSRSGERQLRRIAGENGGTYRFIAPPKEKRASESPDTDAAASSAAP